jgi:hypothetical protein
VWETDWLTGPEDQVVDIVSEEGRKSFNFISMGFNYEGVIKDEMAPLPEFSELVAWNHYEEIDEIPPEDEVDFSAGKDYMDSDRFP